MPIDFKELYLSTKALQDQPAHFSSKLPSETLVAMQAESEGTLRFLATLQEKALAGELSEQQFIHISKVFLTVRWSIIKKSNIAYTFHLFLPANQACIKLAESIVTDEEAICQLLMPGVNKIVGIPDVKPSELKDYTEEKVINKQGKTERRFLAHEFFITENAKSKKFDILYHVSSLFEYASANTSCLFPTANEDKSEVKFDLDINAFFCLQRIAGEASQQYFDTLKAFHQQKYHVNTLGYQLKLLADNLKAGSVAPGGTGQELQADFDKFAGAIKAFYDRWQSLDSSIKIK